ncbi:MAG TPA: oligosaccharide flippase family protein [Chitinophagales bacterium]|nr:oligosaccharide flippase family protein [Chitinophagales bacterium]
MNSSKKLLLNSSIYILLGFLAPAVNFILLPIYTNHLIAEDYALITQSALIQSVFMSILGFGVNAAFTRYYYNSYNDPEKLDELYSTTIISLFFSSFVIILLTSLIGNWLIGVSFSNNIFTYWGYGIYSILIALIFNLQTLTLAFYRNKEQAIHYAVIAIVSFLCVSICIYIGVVVLDLKAKGSIVGRFIGISIPVILYYIWYYIKKPFRYSSELNKQMLLYGLPLVPYLILNVILSQADKFAIERYFDMKTLGLYGFGFLIASVNDIFINSLTSAISPQIYKNMKIDTEDSNKKIQQLIKIYVYLGIIVNIGITIFGTLCIYYLINKNYQSVALFFPLLSLSYIPRIFFTAYQIPVFYYEETKVLPFINLFTLIVYIIGFIALAPILGIYGVCIAAIIIKASQMVSLYLFIKHKKLDKKNGSLFQLKDEYVVSLVIFIYIGFWYLISQNMAYQTKFLYLLPLFFTIFPYVVYKTIKTTSFKISDILSFKK